MNIGSLIGKDIRSNEAVVFMSTIPEKADISTELGTTYYSFLANGVELLVDTASSRITTVFLKNTQKVTYPGPLPNGLDFAMSRDQVRATLGRVPDKSSEDMAYDVWEDGAFQLRIEYRSKFSKIKYVIAQG